MNDETATAPNQSESQARLIYDRLVQAYGEPTWREHRDPVSELVLTFLSQNTSDTNSHRAFEQLRDRFPSWEGVMQAPTDDVADAIRSGGLADIKAPRIQEALSRIQEEQGELSLDFLAERSAEEAREWLTSLKGIGPKSAAIMLLFSLGKPAFPVDTHVHRVSRRLGVVTSKASPEQTQDVWEQLVQPERYYTLHLNLIAHGRQLCKARSPSCEECPLRDLCVWYAEHKGGEGQDNG